MARCTAERLALQCSRYTIAIIRHASLLIIQCHVLFLIIATFGGDVLNQPSIMHVYLFYLITVYPLHNNYS